MPAHISVGDVVGHDLHAAAVMGQVRIALRAYALDGRGPADVVTRLDRFMTEAEIEFATTVEQGVLSAAKQEAAASGSGRVRRTTTASPTSRHWPTSTTSVHPQAT
ncbi:MAG: hypothetical protein QOH09_1351 [Pseudonocardiales bacterium]|jgi:serine phosphatase RsbU (regulator of sigma subunit)|nr:hypothetical protein [Pseudonocardiales bacterium]